MKNREADKLALVIMERLFRYYTDGYYEARYHSCDTQGYERIRDEIACLIRKQSELKAEGVEIEPPNGEVAERQERGCDAREEST